jgi:multiple sugar transport system substrate-binding protein
VRRGAWARTAAALAIAGIALAAACTQKAHDESLVFWTLWPVEAVQPIVDRFRLERPDVAVRVETLSREGGLERIAAAIETGNPPDLCELPSDWMPRLLHAGWLADWSAGVADLRDSLEGWPLCSIGDAAYGVPWLLDAQGLFYNRGLFARAGLDSTRPPATWAELRAAAQAIQKLGGETRGFGLPAGDSGSVYPAFMPFAWGNGGRDLTDDNAHAAFDSARTVEAIEFYASLAPLGRVDRAESLEREFRAGRLGLLLAGGGLLAALRADPAAPRFGVAPVPMPAAERGEPAAFADGRVLAGFQASRRKAEALDLARFLVRADETIALVRAVGTVQPASVAADTNAYYRNRHEERALVLQRANARGAPNHPAWPGMQAAIEDEVTQAVLGGRTAAEAAAAAHARIEALAGRRR